MITSSSTVSAAGPDPHLPMGFGSGNTKIIGKMLDFFLLINFLVYAEKERQ